MVVLSWWSEYSQFCTTELKWESFLGWRGLDRDTDWRHQHCSHPSRSQGQSQPLRWNHLFISIWILFYGFIDVGEKCKCMNNEYYWHRSHGRTQWFRCRCHLFLIINKCFCLHVKGNSKKVTTVFGVLMRNKMKLFYILYHHKNIICGACDHFVFININTSYFSFPRHYHYVM